MVLLELKQYTKEMYKDLLIKAEEMYDRPFREIPLKFSKRLTSCGGKFRWGAYKGSEEIIISAVLMEKHGKAFVDEVLPHEFAHYVTRTIYGTGRHIKAHGKEWKATMRKFGREPKRTHDFEAVGRDVYDYRIGDVEFTLGAIRHMRTQRRQKTYAILANGKKHTILPEHWILHNEHPRKPVDVEIENIQLEKEPVKKEFPTKAKHMQYLIKFRLRNLYNNLYEALQDKQEQKNIMATVGFSSIGQTRAYLKFWWKDAGLPL